MESGGEGADRRNPNTDGDALSGVGLKDGQDLNPRADALMLLELTELKFLENPDENSGSAELYIDELRIDLPLTSGDYVFGVDESKYVAIADDTGGFVNIPETLIDKVLNEGRAQEQMTATPDIEPACERIRRDERRAPDATAGSPGPSGWFTT